MIIHALLAICNCSVANRLSFVVGPQCSSATAVERSGGWLAGQMSGKGEGTVHPATSHVGPQGEQRYSYTLSLTLALSWGGWSTSRPGRFTPPPPGKTRYPLNRRLGGTQGWSGRARKISPPPGLDPRTVQPVASRYTD